MQNDNTVSLHPMTLDEAKATLAAINYREDWSVPELIEACADLAEAERKRVSIALRVTAAAYQQEATALRAEAAGRF